MSPIKTITLRLEADEYARLEAEAERQGMQPDALAREYVRARLCDGETDAERKRRIGLEALDRLAALRDEIRRAGYPAVDAVQLVREGREELERRPSL
jgi:hypothetical protein